MFRFFVLVFILSAFVVSALGMNDEELFYSKCSLCHGTSIITSKKLVKKDWEKTVKKMKGYGAKLSSLEIKRIADYLFLNYGK